MERVLGACGRARDCDIRACVLERGVANYACCRDYGREKISEFFEKAPEAKVALENIRRNL